MLSEAMQQLVNRRNEIYKTLNTMTATSVGGKPNAMSADSGTSVNHVEWRRSLYEELKSINDLIREQKKIDEELESLELGIDNNCWEIQTPLD